MKSHAPPDLKGPKTSTHPVPRHRCPHLWPDFEDLAAPGHAQLVGAGGHRRLHQAQDWRKGVGIAVAEVHAEAEGVVLHHGPGKGSHGCAARGELGDEDAKRSVFIITQVPEQWIAASIPSRRDLPCLHPFHGVASSWPAPAPFPP